jgi:hypothetical protein
MTLPITDRTEYKPFEIEAYLDRPHTFRSREEFDDAIEKAKGETLGLEIERKGTQVEALQLQNNEGSPSPYVSNTSHVSLAEGGKGLLKCYYWKSGGNFLPNQERNRISQTRRYQTPKQTNVS